MSKLLDKTAEVYGAVKGIFNSTEPPPKVTDDEINTEAEEQLVKMANDDYIIFKEKRSGIEDVWRKEQQMWKGDQWKDLRPPDNGPYPERMEYVGNVAWSQIESIVSRLTGWMPDATFEPTEEGDEQIASTLNSFIPYELNQIKFKPKHLRAVRRMVIHGPLIYEVCYDPTVEGGRGMNRWEGQADIMAVNFGSFFPDPSTKDFINLQKGRAHILNYLMTLDYIKERWPKQGVKVMADNRSSETEIFDRDSETIMGTTLKSEDNRTTANVLRYMYKGKPKYMSSEDIKLFKEKAADNIADGIDPLENEQKAKGEAKGIHFLYVTTNGVFLQHASYVYDHGQYPIIARTLFPEEDNPWGKGYMRDMISPQTMYNRFCELAIEVTSKMGNSAIVYGTAAGMSDAIKQIWRRIRGKAGAMLPVEGDVNQVKELQGVPPNPGIFQYIQHFLEMMQKIPGVFDSANGAANPNVTSGRQSEALIAAAQGRLSSAAELIEDAAQETMEQFIEVCAQYYTTERVARITGKQVSFSRDAMTKQVETNQPMTGDDGQPVMQIVNGMPVPVMLKEEYIPKMDVRVTIGVEKPKDREYWIQTAYTLFKTIDPLTQLPMIDAEAVRFTVENGRMEPFSVIEERQQKEQQLMQKMQELQIQNRQLQQQNEQMQQDIGKAQQDNMSGQADLLKAENEKNKTELQAQQQFHSQEMDKAKLGLEAAKIDQTGQRQLVNS
jgi:hypothetical protein